jgi:hypothetical protein
VAFREISPGTARVTNIVTATRTAAASGGFNCAELIPRCPGQWRSSARVELVF